MPEFTYEALAKDGHRESSTISAPSMAAAGHLIKEQGLLPTTIKEKAGKITLAKNPLQFFQFVSLKEKITFIENLSVMLKAGIPISRCLQILSKQTRNAQFKAILMDVAGQVEAGKSLGEALEKYPKVFSNIFTSMIKVGELSGNLDKSLEYLTIQLERDANLVSKTRGAMIYPSVIVVAMVVIGILLSIYVLPSLTATFKDAAIQLPLTTRIVIFISDIISQHAVLVIGGLLAFCAGSFYGLSTPAGQRGLDFVLLHFLIVSEIVKKINMARFARILSSLLKSGIPIVEGLQVAGQSLGNSYYSDLVVKASRDVKLGKPLSDTLNQNNKLFPVLIIQMLEVGEESGTTEEILGQLASHFEEEVDTTLSNMSSVVEPLLLLIIGAVVGVLALALIAPIYQLSSSIQ